MQDAGAAPRRVRLPRALCGAARVPLSQALISSRRCLWAAAEITVDPLVGRIATHFAYVAQAEGMDVFLSQQLVRRTSGGHAVFLAACFAASADARCADAGAARASPSRYSTAPGSLPVSPAGEAAGGATGRGPSALHRRTGSGGARKAAPRGRRTLAAEPSASPAPPERDAFTTPFPAAGGAPSPVDASADRPPPLFWLGGAGAAEAPAAEEEPSYDDDFGGGGAFDDAPADDEFAPMPAAEAAEDAEDAEVPDADAPAVELPSAEAPPGAGHAAVPAVTGEASSFHVQCGQGPPGDGDDDAVASGGKRGKAAAAARLQRASTATPKTVAARARAPPPPPLFASPAVAGTPGDAPRRAVRAARQDWACAVCTLENPITVQRCNACNTRRGMSPPAAAEPAAARVGPSASKRGREATTPRGGSGAGGMPPPPAPSTAKRHRGGEDGEKENAAAAATGGKGSRARAVSEAPTPRGAAAAAAIAAVTPATVKRSAPKTPAEALGSGWPAVARTWVLSPSGLNGDQKTVRKQPHQSPNSTTALTPICPAPQALKEFAEECGATYSRDWSEVRFCFFQIRHSL